MSTVAPVTNDEDDGDEEEPATAATQPDVTEECRLTRHEDSGTSSTLALGLLLLLTIHGVYALNSPMEHRGIEPPHLQGSSLVSNQLVLLGLVTVDGAALLIEARVVTPQISKIFFLCLIQHPAAVVEQPSTVVEPSAVAASELEAACPAQIAAVAR